MLSNTFRSFPTVAAASALLLLAAGCMGPRIKPGQPAFVHVAPNGIVSFMGEPTTLNDLPKQLKRAGVQPDTVVKIVADGEVSDRLLKSIIAGLNRQGFRRAVAEGGKRASVTLDGQAAPDVPPASAILPPVTGVPGN